MDREQQVEAVVRLWEAGMLTYHDTMDQISEIYRTQVDNIPCETKAIE